MSGQDDPLTEHPSQEAPDKSADTFDSVYNLASGLLWQDRRFILTLYPLLILPELIIISFRNPLDYILIFQFLVKGVELTFLYFVCRRWVCKLSPTPGLSYRPGALAQTIFLGTGLWLLLILPLLLTLFAPPELRLLFLLSLIPAVLIVLKYYFFFFPIALHITPLQQALSTASTFTRERKSVALLALISPLGFMFFASSLVGGLSPDGRIHSVLYLMGVVEGLFPVLATYLGLAFSLHLVGEKEWHDSSLDPYRVARLSTLEVSGPELVGKLLKPRTGLTLLFMGLLIWMANQIRAAEIPPSATVQLESIEIDNKLVRLKLHLRDGEYQFRGFSPLSFNLTGENGVTISPSPAKIFLNGHQMQEALPFLPDSMEAAEIVVEFECERSAEELQALQDLYLWHRRARLEWLDMKNARLLKGGKNKADQPVEKSAAEQTT